MGSNNGKPVLRDADVSAIMKTSGMSEDQVRQDFEIFVKQYPTGISLAIQVVVVDCWLFVLPFDWHHTNSTQFFFAFHIEDKLVLRDGKTWHMFLPGAMMPTVFKQMVYKMLPVSDADKMEKHVLRVYDENNDGVVDFTEFMVMYYIMSAGTPEEVLVKIFRIFDVNSDGVISNMEMLKLITDMYGMLKKEVDTNNTGT